MIITRFIPAGAGNAAKAIAYFNQAQVHPRRRGERCVFPHANCVAFGSSPQARGTHGQASAPLGHRRFIPAGAGNAPRRDGALRGISVHPRRRGERLGRSNVYLYDHGSSPQARGTRGPPTGLREEARFIPAGAGNAKRDYRAASDSPVHPRRRGERPRRNGKPRSEAGSSPQARGTRLGIHKPANSDRFIPAGAGNARRLTLL